MHLATEFIDELKQLNFTSIVEWQAYKDNQIVGSLDDSILDCKQCLNRGYYYTAHDADNNLLYTPAMVKCKCLKARNSHHNARKSGLGNLTNHRIADFKTIEDWQKDLKQLATDYVLTASQEWFVVLGQSGAGKTMLCSAIINKRLADGYEAKYMLWRDYIETMKQSKFDNKRNNHNHYFKYYADSEILYIDDLFKCTVTDTDKSYAFEMINHRYNKNLTTIISSEMLVTELAEIDQAVAGRVKERAGRYLFPIGKDISKNYRFRGDDV